MNAHDLDRPHMTLLKAMSYNPENLGRMIARLSAHCRQLSADTSGADKMNPENWIDNDA